MRRREHPVRILALAALSCALLVGLAIVAVVVHDLMNRNATSTPARSHATLPSDHLVASLSRPSRARSCPPAGELVPAGTTTRLKPVLVGY
jgi:hypothetical protein